jgi:CDP-diacylglycerol--serine O-phosphatidyltransferase
MVAGMVWCGIDYNILGTDIGWLVALLTGLAGLLMVSNFKYNSFKEVDCHGLVAFVAILVVFLVFFIVATARSLVLFIVFILYAIAGPFNTFKSVDKVTLVDVVGETEEDADFIDKEDTHSDTTNNKASDKE